MSNFLTCSQGLLRSGPAHFSRLIFSPFPLPGPKAILWLYWTQLYHILSHFPDITQESLLPSTPPHAWLILNNYLNLLLDITPSKKSSLMSHVWLWCLHNVHPPYPLPLLCWVCAVPPPPGCRRCESKDCTHLMGGQNLCPQKAGCQESPEEGWFVYSFWYFSDSSSPARKSGIMDYSLRCSSYICRCSSREKRSPVVSLPGSPAPCVGQASFHSGKHPQEKVGWRMARLPFLLWCSVLIAAVPLYTYSSSTVPFPVVSGNTFSLPLSPKVEMASN